MNEFVRASHALSVISSRKVELLYYDDETEMIQTYTAYVYALHSHSLNYVLFSCSFS